METFVADFVDKHHIYYTCNHCFTHYNLNGKPRKNSKNKIHIHGSNGDLSNRIENRSSHCGRGNVDIIINETTKRK